MNNTADIEGLMSTDIAIINSSYPCQVVIMNENHVAIRHTLCSPC